MNTHNSKLEYIRIGFKHVQEVCITRVVSPQRRSVLFQQMEGRSAYKTGNVLCGSPKSLVTIIDFKLYGYAECGKPAVTIIIK